MDAVMYLATNCLCFKGSKETLIDLSDNYPQSGQENFLNLISLAKYDSTKYQSDDIKKGQVPYLPKTIQYEVIDIMSYKVLNNVINDIKETNNFTIMFDCTPGVSHMAR